MKITKHSKERIVERDEKVSCYTEAKRTAKQAYISGKTLNHFQKCPSFYNYLWNKKGQARNCSIRVYHGNIYIWKGRSKTLVTAHPIPDRFKNELEAQNLC